VLLSQWQMPCSEVHGSTCCKHNTLFRLPCHLPDALHDCVLPAPGPHAPPPKHTHTHSCTRRTPALPLKPSTYTSVASDTLTLVTPEEASRGEAMGGGHKASKQCMAACKDGQCYRLPPAHKCCYVPRANPNNPAKSLRDWYCHNQLVGK
jgi:hypothetical protein